MSQAEHDNVISGLIEAAEQTRRAWRYPADHVVFAVLPDWLLATLTTEDRQRLLDERHVLVRSHAETYGEEAPECPPIG